MYKVFGIQTTLTDMRSFNRTSLFIETLVTFKMKMMYFEKIELS